MRMGRDELLSEMERLGHGMAIFPGDDFLELDEVIFFLATSHVLRQRKKRRQETVGE